MILVLMYSHLTFPFRGQGAKRAFNFAAEPPLRIELRLVSYQDTVLTITTMAAFHTTRRDSNPPVPTLSGLAASAHYGHELCESRY
jgi:hypothetical protein